MKRTPLKRTQLRYRPKRRPRFPDGLHDQVVNRDGACIVFLMDPKHVCSDRNGPHAPDDKGRLTVDHFWPESGGRRSQRAPHTLRTLTAMCWKANFDGPSRDVRTFQRDWTRRIYEEQSAA